MVNDASSGDFFFQFFFQMRPRISITGPVRPSVRWSVRPSRSHHKQGKSTFHRLFLIAYVIRVLFTFAFKETTVMTRITPLHGSTGPGEFKELLLDLGGNYCLSYEANG